MKKKSKLEKKILSDNEITSVGDAVKEFMGSHLVEYAESLGLNFEDTIRFHAVTSKCIEARESKQLSIKDVSQKLKIPQYKLKFVEKGSIKNIEPQILKSYIDFLGLSNWFKSWLKSNSQLNADYFDL